MGQTKRRRQTLAGSWRSRRAAREIFGPIDSGFRRTKSLGNRVKRSRSYSTIQNGETTTSRRDLARSLRRSRPHKQARLRHRRLQAERLEDRRLLSLSPLDSIPVLNSNPGATASLYLDFNGHFEPVWGSYNNVVTPVYDVDGDSTTFSDVELANMQTVWESVSETYAPFNINVTTVEPSVLAPGMPIDAANGVALRVAIGAFLDNWVFGSYLNSFTNSNANVVYAHVGVVYPNEPADWAPKLIADSAFHAAGHAFGLKKTRIMPEITFGIH